MRAIRPRSAAEIAFCGLGPVAESFLRAAAAAGTPVWPMSLPRSPSCAGIRREALAAALERALAFRRFGAADVRSILAAGSGVPRRSAGERLAMDLPAVPVRSLAAYALEPVR